MHLLKTPLIAAQSLWIRSMSPLLPAAGGPNHGSVDAPGHPPYRLGVVGESAAASVGAETHEQGIPGVLARSLAAGTQRRVEWVVFGSRSATITRVRQKLVPLLPADLDLVVLLTGFNDALANVKLEDWSIDIAATIEDLAVRNRHVVVSGIPPPASFPALPQPMAEHVDELSELMDEITQMACADRPGVTFAPNRALFDAHPDVMLAPESINPTPEGYELWATSMAKLVLPI